MPLHTRILLGLILGAVAGVASNLLFFDTPALNWVVSTIAYPVGQIFLRLLFMIVIPLVFASVALGVASLGDLKRVGRIGGKTLGVFLVTTVIGAILGLILINLLAPGASLDPAVRAQLMEQFGAQASERVAIDSGFGIQTLVNIIPRNPIDAMARSDMLGVIFFSLMVGIALTQVRPERARPVTDLLEGIVDVVTLIIGYAMKLAPYGVFALIFAVTAGFGFGLMRSLALYVAAVLAGLILHLLGVIGGLARVLAGVPYGTFFRKSRALMVTAFSTSSSSATLPTTIATAREEFGVPREIASFVLPVGATLNMNGTAVFVGMTVLFLAQVFGVEMTLAGQLVVVTMAVVIAIAAAGVPSGSIPLIILTLDMVGVPGEGIALILGVDRILDMSRTVPNVMDDLLTALVVTKSEGMPLKTD